MARAHLSHVVASDDDHVRLWTVTKADVQYLCKAWLLTSAQYDELRTSNSFVVPRSEEDYAKVFLHFRHI